MGLEELMRCSVIEMGTGRRKTFLQREVPGLAPAAIADHFTSRLSDKVCIIFLIAGLGVMAEVIRSARSSAAKEAVKAEQMKTLVDKKDAISLRVAKQAAMISELEEIVNECIRLETTAQPSPETGEK